MAAAGDRSGTPLARIKAALDDLPGWLSVQDDASLGEPLIEIRGIIDRSESVFADGVRRLDKSGEYRADGALSLTDWLRWKCKLSGGAALERVEIARQLEKLPKTEAAFASGDLGYQHVVLIARAAENVGSGPVQKEEHNLLKAAQTMDPGRLPRSPRASSTGSMLRQRWGRPTAPTSDGIFTSASRRMAWSVLMASWISRAGRR